MTSAILVLLIATAYIGVPATLASGWWRWLQQPRQYNPIAIFSLAGFIFGNASALLALGTTVYAAAIGGFPFYDPGLLRIYGFGLLIALSAFILSIPGVWRRNPLRWHAPVLSFGMLALWCVWATGE
jgi:hypothetical protein